MPTPPHATLTRYPAQSYLACALADGSVVVTTVVQVLGPLDANPGFFPQYKIGVAVEDTDNQVYSADHRGTTSLRWIDTAQEEVSLGELASILVDSIQSRLADSSFHKSQRRRRFRRIRGAISCPTLLTSSFLAR